MDVATMGSFPTVLQPPQSLDFASMDRAAKTEIWSTHVQRRLNVRHVSLHRLAAAIQRRAIAEGGQKSYLFLSI
jgi:hypothetical protein